MPFSLKETVASELDRLEEEGVLKKVDHADWAAPIVVVPKGEGQIRICGDYKVTINPELDIDRYPLPKPDDLLASLAGGQRFSKIDLTQAYIPTDEIKCRVPKVCDHKHSKGVVPVSALAFWGSFGTRLVSENNGYHPARYPKCHMLH